MGSRRRIKNLAQLNAALPDLVPNELRERCFAHYLARSEPRADPEVLRDAVILLSLERRHRWSGCKAP